MTNFSHTSTTRDAMRAMKLKVSILALSLSSWHAQNGDNTADGVVQLYGVDGYTQEEVQTALQELESLQLITTS